MNLNIAFGVQQLSQYISKSKVVHFKVFICVLQYLKISHAIGLFFSITTNLHLPGFTYSNWTVSSVFRKLSQGMQSFQAHPSSHENLKSKELCLSAEYRALASLAWEIQLLHELFKDLNKLFTQPTSVYCDNNSTIYLAHNPSFHERSKHIEIYFHVTRERIEAIVIKISPIHTRTQLVKFSIKLLSNPVLEFHISKFGLLNLHSPVYEGELHMDTLTELSLYIIFRLNQLLQLSSLYIGCVVKQHVFWALIPLCEYT